MPAATRTGCRERRRERSDTQPREPRRSLTRVAPSPSQRREARKQVDERVLDPDLSGGDGSQAFENVATGILRRTTPRTPA